MLVRTVYKAKVSISKPKGIPTLLVRKTTLSVWALGITLSSITVLWCTIDLLRLSILRWWLACWLVADRRQLWATHLVRHHARLAIMRWSTLWLPVLTVACCLLTGALLVLFSRIFLFLLFSFPFFA